MSKHNTKVILPVITLLVFALVIIVILTINKQSKDVEQLLTQAITAIKAHGYFVSTGHCHSHGEISMDELLKTAEARMYADKRDFYSRAGNDRRARS